MSELIQLVKNKEKVPHRPGVYEIIEKGKTIYIGQSMNMKQRLKHHRLLNYSKTAIIYEIIEEEELRDKKEKEYIQSKRPKYNKEFIKSYTTRPELNIIIYWDIICEKCGEEFRKKAGVTPEKCVCGGRTFSNESQNILYEDEFEGNIKVETGDNNEV